METQPKSSTEPGDIEQIVAWIDLPPWVTEITKAVVDYLAAFIERIWTMIMRRRATPALATAVFLASWRRLGRLGGLD